MRDQPILQDSEKEATIQEGYLHRFYISRMADLPVWVRIICIIITVSLSKLAIINISVIGRVNFTRCVQYVPVNGSLLEWIITRYISIGFCEANCIISMEDTCRP